MNKNKHDDHVNKIPKLRYEIVKIKDDPRNDQARKKRTGRNPKELKHQQYRSWNIRKCC